MPGIVDLVKQDESSDERQTKIVDVLVDAFSDLMAADPDAFRNKFRKMAAGPFAFYRGSAPLFYADMEGEEDRWADDRTSRVWIQGDLHAENFGTYMAGDGVFVFDVNDFDEAYLGHFTWDIKRMVASVALLGWTKAISDDNIASLIETYVRAYMQQVHYFVHSDRDHEYSLRLETTDGDVRKILLETRLNTRVNLLDRTTLVDENFDRRFRRGSGVRELDDAERKGVQAAYEAYLETIPEAKRFRSLTYQVKDIVGRQGFGIGSAGLPAYNILVEGPTQALENDVVLSMKQGNVAAPSRIVHDERLERYFKHHGHRTAVSQRALQAHADPWLGYTEMDGVGFVVSELSPYLEDIEWSDFTEPEEMAPVLDYLGRARDLVEVGKLLDLAVFPLDPREVGLPDDPSISGLLELSRHIFELPVEPVHVDPITLIPCSTSQNVDPRVMPCCSKYSVLPRSRSRPFMIITMSKGLST